jgi:2-methylcitrate dehydratase PrpD
MDETRRLAEWVVNTSYDDLPTEVIEAARIYTLDNLAAGFAGAHQPWTEMVADLAFETGIGACSVFGHSATASAPAAALVNGSAVGGFEVDHPFSPGNCHPSGAVFPAVLAASEIAPLDGRGFLTAMATGYEALCRVGLAATRAVEDERGFHGPGTNAPIGAALATSKALGFDMPTTVNAIGVAASHGSGIVEFFREGAMTKRLHLGRGSQLGLESALLAQRGFTGPSTALEGEHGFLNVYSPAPRLEELLADLGAAYRLFGVTLKAYPCHISFHAVIDALVRFKQTQPIDPQSLTSLAVVGNARMMQERFAARAPTTLMGAQYSMPFSIALTLCRDTSDPAVWTAEALQDPLVTRLAASIELRHEPPSSPDAVADLVLEAAGTRHVVPATTWKGGPNNPCSFDDVAHKFERYARAHLPSSRIEEIIHRTRGLEDEADASRLVRLIRVP